MSEFKGGFRMFNLFSLNFGNTIAEHARFSPSLLTIYTTKILGCIHGIAKHEEG